MADLKFKTRAKIARVKMILPLLSEDQAKVINELCVAHAAMAETNSRLWKDNTNLRKQIAGLERAHDN